MQGGHSDGADAGHDAGDHDGADQGADEPQAARPGAEGVNQPPRQADQDRYGVGREGDDHQNGVQAAGAVEVLNAPRRRRDQDADREESEENLSPAASSTASSGGGR
jgi:hypothetical protein